MLTITAIYTGLCALLLVALSALVIRERARTHVSLGDGGDKRLEKSIRAQGNFVEYTPLALIVLALAEMQGAPALALHGLGATLVIGRVLHGWGLTRERESNPARGLGAAMTFAVLMVGGVGLVVHAIL